MTKQKRSKIQKPGHEKQNQGQRLAHLQIPMQKKHIFKNKKKTQLHERSISNSALDISTSTSPSYHNNTFFKSHFLHQAQNLLKQPLSASLNISLPIEESECKDYFFGQFKSEFFKKFNRSQQFNTVLGYMSSIGEHLLDQQLKFPMPVLNYNSNGVFCENERLKSIQLIYSFCFSYRFKSDTIFLALNIFHRISFDRQFDAYDNTLKAISSLFVASKYQEIAIPKLETFVNIDRSQAISTDDVLKLESHMLIYFKFSIGFPSPLQFIELLVIRYDIEQDLKNKMIQLCYLSLSNLALLQGKGSLLALTCLIMIRPNTQIDLERNDYLKHELGWRLEQLTKLSLMQ